MPPMPQAIMVMPVALAATLVMAVTQVMAATLVMVAMQAAGGVPAARVTEVDETPRTRISTDPTGMRSPAPERAMSTSRSGS